MRLRRARLREEGVGAGVALHGPLWCGDGTSYDDGVIVVDGHGTVTAAGPAADVPIPFGALEIVAGWIGPGLRDDHVHLAFGDPADYPRSGVVAVRDLGAPPAEAVVFRALAAPAVQVAGPLLTAPGGYPSRTWGADGFAAFVDDADQATRLVTGLAAQVDVVKLALEPAAGPVPTAAVCAAVVGAAHAADRQVSCHALSVAMVERALDAGVDELAHTPTERLPDELVGRIAAAEVRVVSTLHTFTQGRDVDGRTAIANAARLAAAGVVVRYGTDLGNAGIRAGADTAELALLANGAGLGAEGALRAATQPLRAGATAGVVGLDADPREKPAAWHTPRVVVVGRTLLRRD